MFDWYKHPMQGQNALKEEDYDWYINKKSRSENEKELYSPISNSNLFLFSSLKSPVVLVGLGPHAKRIYMHYFSKYNFAPKLIVELESKKNEIEEYLASQDHKVETFYIPDTFRDGEDIPGDIQEELLNVMQKHKITHAIISTEPKAHFAYLKFFLKNKIHTLTDKPITSPVNVSNDKKMAAKIKEDFDCLEDLYKEAKENGVYCEVQVQRRWHKGYTYIRNLLKNCIEQYGIPITNIEVYHCDGMWNMPDEFLYRENHPYKYGYGKLFHSGYHFIDLMCWMAKLNDYLPNKKPDNVELYAAVTRPDDFMNVINNEDYMKLFNTEKFNPVFQNFQNHKFHEFGEIDFYSLIQLKKADNVITTCSLNLLQSGFSRRSWTELPKDTYKSNGRVRHERMNIQLGPLMNIQVHSYQSKEIKDRNEFDNGEVGTVEHFDIYVFRNVDIVGGEPFEKITLEDLMHVDDGKTFIGYNEQSREKCMVDFLLGTGGTSDLLDHKLTTKILSNAYMSVCKRKEGESPVVKFNLD